MILEPPRRQAIGHVFHVFGDLALAGLILLILDVSLFHCRLYVPFLRPDSYSGRVEATSRRFHRALDAFPGPDHLVVLGDSTTGASVQEEQLENELRHFGYKLRATNIAQGGSTSRSWYHLVANERIGSDTTRLVLLGIHPGSLVEFETLKPDLDIVKSRVRVNDAETMVLGYSSVEMKSRVFFGTFFRLPWFRDDLRDFFQDPLRRVEGARTAAAREARQGIQDRRRNDSLQDLLSARLGSDNHLIEDDLDRPIRNNLMLRAQLERGLRRQRNPPRQRLAMDPAKRLLLERLLRLLDRREIRTVIFVTPHGPFPFANRDLSDLESLVETLREEGVEVTFLHDTALLDVLEAPEYFRDSLHLNARGAELFTSSLALSVAEVLDDSG